MKRSYGCKAVAERKETYSPFHKMIKSVGNLPGEKTNPRTPKNP